MQHFRTTLEHQQYLDILHVRQVGKVTSMLWYKVYATEAGGPDCVYWRG